MTGMDHAAAHERIEDLLLEPARLAALESSADAADVALREHLDACLACRADLEGWRRLQLGLADALPGSVDAAVASVEPIELPPSLRARTLAAVRGAERPSAPISMGSARSRFRVAVWVGLAASIIVLSGAAVITVDQVARRSAAEADAQALSAVVAAVDRVLAASGHKVVELRTPAGGGAGTISWSRHDWVVLTTALAEPADGRVYLCWLQQGDRSVPVGKMEFASGTAFWAASLDEWATWEINADTRFVVTLEAAGAQQRTGPAVLSADLRSD